MAATNANTYTLAPEIAAQLRVPRYRYPADIVPHESIAEMVIDARLGLTPDVYPALAGDLHVQSLATLMALHGRRLTKTPTI